MNGLFSQLAAQFAPKINTGDPLLTTVLQWMTKVQGHALMRWRMLASQGVRCALQEMAGPSTVRPCPRIAVEPCTLCHEPVCLEHAAVTVHGTVACLRCLTMYEKVIREQVRKQATEDAANGVPPRDANGRPSPGAPPGDKPPPTEVELRARHLVALGLKDPADWAEINGAFRELAKKLHPDRATPAKREASAKRLKVITEAHAWLKAHEKAAA